MEIEKVEIETTEFQPVELSASIMKSNGFKRHVEHYSLTKMAIQLNG